MSEAVVAPAPAGNSAAPAEGSAPPPVQEALPPLPGSKAPVKAKAPVKPVEAGQVEEQKPPDDGFELLVDGKKKHLTREQAVRELQKREAAEKRFSQAAEMTKKTQALLEALKNPDSREKVLEHILGDDFDTIVESRLARRAQDAMMSPEERQRFSEQQELERYRTSEKRRQEEGAKAHQAAQEQATIGHYEKALSAIVEKAGFPQTPETLSVLAEVMMQGLELEESGVQFSEEQIIGEVRDRLNQVTGERDKRIASGLKGEQLLSYLGESTVQAVIEAITAKYENKNPYEQKQKEAPKPASNAPGKLSEAAYKEWLAKNMSGKF